MSNIFDNLCGASSTAIFRRIAPSGSAINADGGSTACTDGYEEIDCCSTNQITWSAAVPDMSSWVDSTDRVWKSRTRIHNTKADPCLTNLDWVQFTKPNTCSVFETKGSAKVCAADIAECQRKCLNEGSLTGVSKTSD